VASANLPRKQGQGSQPAAYTENEDGHSVVVLPDGRRLEYREYGDANGVPIMFMHGNMNSRLFDPCYERTQWVTSQEGARIIAFDRPGVGGSSPHNDGDYASSAKDCGDAASALGLRSFAVLGYSSGGPHALAAATLLPSATVTCLGLISCDGPNWLMRQEGTFPFVETEKTWEEAVARSQELYAEVLHNFEQFLFGTEKESRLADMMEARRQGWDGIAHDKFIEGKAWPFEPRPLDIPVLMWHGGKDPTVPLPVGEFLAKRLQVEVQVFKRETHALVQRKWVDILRELVAAHNKTQESR
jgi:pimeloyl-ACP methyl ester carboxylesterase